VSELPISSHQASTTDLLTTLFALGREVTSVLDLTELLRKIPDLIARLTKFNAFAVYLLDPGGHELSIAYSVGYPDELARTLRVNVGRGLVGLRWPKDSRSSSTTFTPICGTSRRSPARTQSSSCRCVERVA